MKKIMCPICGRKYQADAVEIGIRSGGPVYHYPCGHDIKMRNRKKIVEEIDSKLSDHDKKMFAETMANECMSFPSNRAIERRRKAMRKILAEWLNGIPAIYRSARKKTIVNMKVVDAANEEGKEYVGQYISMKKSVVMERWSNANPNYDSVLFDIPDSNAIVRVEFSINNNISYALDAMSAEGAKI